MIYGYDRTNNLFRALVPGRYTFTASVALTAIDPDIEVEIRFYVDGVAAEKGQLLTTGGAAGDVRVSATSTFDMVRGTFVEVYIRHEHGSNRSIDTGSDDSYWSGWKDTR